MLCVSVTPVLGLCAPWQAFVARSLFTEGPGGAGGSVGLSEPPRHHPCPPPWDSSSSENEPEEGP